MSGPTLAILGAFCFALSAIFVRRGVIKVSDASIGVLVGVPLSLPLLLLILAATGSVYDILSFPWQSYIWLAIAGLLNFVAGRMFNFTAVQYLGANITGVFIRFSPIVAVTIGVSVLDIKHYSQLPVRGGTI